jgi:hypothetical protein
MGGIGGGNDLKRGSEKCNNIWETLKLWGIAGRPRKPVNVRNFY